MENTLDFDSSWVGNGSLGAMNGVSNSQAVLVEHGLHKVVPSVFTVTHLFKVVGVFDISCNVTERGQCKVN